MKPRLFASFQPPKRPSKTLKRLLEAVENFHFWVRRGYHLGSGVGSAAGSPQKKKPKFFFSNRCNPSPWNMMSMKKKYGFVL